MSDEITVLKQEELPLEDMAAANSQKNVSNDEDEEELTYDGFEVARDEFFAHLFKPSVTFNNEQISVNVACLRQLPNVEYVQFLVNRDDKKLAVKVLTFPAYFNFSFRRIQIQINQSFANFFRFK